MFRINPHKNEDSHAAINRFLARMQVQEEVRVCVVERPVSPKSLIQRLETIPVLSQHRLEMIRVELIYLARLLAHSKAIDNRPKIEIRVEAVLQNLILADQEGRERDKKLEGEMADLRNILTTLRTLPEAFYCPLSYSLMRQPVMFRQGFGHSYEQSELVNWIQHCQQNNRPVLDPMTQQEVDGEWIANLALRDAIETLSRHIEASSKDNSSDRQYLIK